MAFDIKVTLHFMHFDVIPNEQVLSCLWKYVWPSEFRNLNYIKGLIAFLTVLFMICTRLLHTHTSIVMSWKAHNGKNFQPPLGSCNIGTVNV